MGRCEQVLEDLSVPYVSAATMLVRMPGFDGVILVLLQRWLPVLVVPAVQLRLLVG